MRFGSVEFFKVLIKTVLAILFFLPLAAAVVFGVLFARNIAQLSEMRTKLKSVEEENRILSVITDNLVHDKAGTIDDFDKIFSMSGIAYDEFLSYVYENDGITAQELYNILSESGLTDKDIITLAASKKTVNGENFYEIMSKNGITDKDIITIIANKNGGKIDNYYEILKQCGLSDDDIVAYINKKNPSASTPPVSSGGSQSTPGSSGETSSTSSDPDSTSEPQELYGALYEDMYVTAPPEYVREEDVIYLTFDDGPSNHTYSILSYLKKANVKATFFVVPNRSEECYATLRAIAADGHAIGVHSATHEYEKIYASVEAFLDDFYEAWDIIREATGITTEIFRFPGGSNNDFNEDTRDAIIAEMSRRGFRFFDWNVDSYDVTGATWTQMYNSIPMEVRGNYRSIVLMHDSPTRQNTVLVLEDVIKVLLDEGYKFDKINSDTKPVQFIGPFS